MNVSYRWLQSLAPSITAPWQAVAERLASLGAPVDELVELGAQLGDVLIARVEEVRQHPNADRLRVCTVNAGGERLQVVCGAPNVTADRFYPFAPVGASLPGGVEIRKAKLRGEVSEGMLCSARELGLGRDHAGLMTLHGEWAPGTPFVEALGLDDARLVVDITANRPDLLSHLGIARELAGVEGIRLSPFSAAAATLEVREGAGEVAGAGVRVTVADAAGCPRYMAAVVRGVSVGPSPEWLATRLRAVGLRPINNVVDATNYVLHELGQPLHAFDLARLEGPEIRVRRAAAGETIRTLDGEERTLDTSMLVIADARRPVAVAGVMGGEDSEVGEGTTDVLLECALFDPRSVRRTARALGLSTDASYRFERGVDPELPPRALRRVVDLVLAIAGGEADSVALDVRLGGFERLRLPLRPRRVEQVLGARIPAAEIGALLAPIGFDVFEEGEELSVEVPGFRGDVTREIDLVEEIARRRGYDSFPEVLSPFRPGVVPEDPLVSLQRRVHALMTRWGLLEARTTAFAPADEARVPLLNPLSAEESHLRDRLAPGLIRRVEYNWARGARDVRLYEVATVFSTASGGALPREEVRLAAALTGARTPPHWSGEVGAWDAWDLKGLLAEVGALLGAGAVEAGHDADDLTGVTEPGERLALAGDGAPAGTGGRVAGSAMDAPAWAAPLWVLEARLPAGGVERPHVRFRALPEHPPVERDLALLLPEGVEAAAVEAVIRHHAGELLEAVWPFDLYLGKGIPEGTRSVAWRLRFRHAERTLTDAEVEPSLQAVLAALDEGLSVRRR